MSLGESFRINQVKLHTDKCDFVSKSPTLFLSHSFEGTWLEAHAEIIRQLQLRGTDVWNFSNHTPKRAYE